MVCFFDRLVLGFDFFSIYSIGKRYSKEDTTLIDRIDALIRFFLYVLIFWLPYSPAVIESCVIICLILWLLKRGILLTKEKVSAGILKDAKPESTFLNKPIAFFLLACLLSVTGSAFFGQSLHNFFTKTLEWFIVYFLVVEVFKDKKQQKHSPEKYPDPSSSRKCYKQRPGHKKEYR